MRKVFLFAMLMVCLLCGAQSLHRVVSLKSLNAGAVVLQRDNGFYKLRMRTKHDYFFVILGNKAEAVQILTYLSELKLGNDDYVFLNNEQETKVSKGPLGGHALYDILQINYCVITRSQAKKLAKVVEDDAEDMPIDSK